jgi:hypothetical protein
MAEVLTNYTIDIPANCCCKLIANQLDHPSGNTLNNIMANLPCNARFMKYNNADGTWTTSLYSTALGRWSNGDTITLNPGEGAFLCPCCTNGFSITFTGLSHAPVLPVNIPVGRCYLLSRQVLGVGTYDNITGFSPPPGATAFKWLCPPGIYQLFQFDDLDMIWNPFDPLAAIGESMWVSTSGGCVPPTPPELPCISVLSLGVDCTNNKVCITFDGTPNPASAGYAGNYAVSPGVTISSSVFTPPNTVCLSLDVLNQYTTYTLSISNVQGLCGGVLSTNLTFMCPTCTPPVIVVEPQSQTVNDCGSATFSVGVSGTAPMTYQWYRDGAALGGANSSSYTQSPVSLADSGSQFYVVACNPCGCVTSQVAILTVAPDTTPPAVISVDVNCESNQVCLRFSEALDPSSAENPANYTVNNGETVIEAMFTPPDTVCLTLTPSLNPSLIYTLSIQGVKDLCGNVLATNIDFSCRTCTPPVIITQPMDRR